MRKPDLKIMKNPLRATLMVHERHKMTPQGTLAVELVRGMALAAVPDGETSTGEMRYRLLTPGEVVAKAVAISKLLYDQLEFEGWVLEIPSLEEIEKFDGEMESTGFLTKAKESV